MAARIMIGGLRCCLRSNIPDVHFLMTGLYRNFVATEFCGSETEAILNQDDSSHFSWRLCEKAGMASTLPSALWSLEAALCEAIIRSQRRSIAIHAATIPIGNSTALLVASSGTGKTTLSLALARRGLPAAGDDVALVEPDTLDVIPIPRCFHVDDRGAALLEADGLRLPPAWARFRFIVPNDFGAPAAPPSRTGRLIFMRGPRAGHASIAPVSQAEMTARLLSETGKGPLSDPETIAVISRLAASASCFALTPGPLGETADAVAALLNESKKTAG
ncbi:MAG TPA: hypothetical protein VH157_15245 [Bryobacteraceae bacterium]|jgi:hypothetical protein|nr:hypothetical protein [Bryobacteraceae bacterium]